MSKVEIYTTMLCPYCVMAKRLLKKKGVDFEEVDVGLDAEQRAAMIRRANGGHTVPQIFVDGRHIGGCDELYELDAAGELDALLEGNAA